MWVVRGVCGVLIVFHLLEICGVETLIAAYLLCSL
jgi:hypothetical protein